MATHVPIGPDTLIAVKIAIEGSNRKFKVPLRDLAPPTLCEKLRTLLDIPDNQPVVFERYSDSAGNFITLDAANPTAFKSLLRAAKAKHKLRLRTVFPAVEGSSSGASATTVMPMANGSQQTLVSDPSTIDPTALAFRPTDTSTVKAEANKAHKAVKPMTGVAICHRTVAAAPKRTSPRLDRNSIYKDFNRLNRQADQYIGPAETKAPIPASWSVFCNACDRPMENDHFHCNICDNGDYDLCQSCVEAGIHCRGTGHWLIKRNIKNGRVVSSQTVTLPPKAESKPESKPLAKLPKVTSMPEIPGAFTDDKKAETIDESEEAPSRTCNSCIEVFPEHHFVTCLDCEDFDLCTTCHEDNAHGHHPAHTFKPVSEHTQLSPMGGFLCAPGRNVRHAALCDGCDKPIFGVRHKCLNCPDWDYCSDCFKNVRFIHAAHRFIPVYEPIAEPRFNSARHVGIYCDGPLCKDKLEYMSGVRYKCAICDDVDFCANCEANPENRHNRTHPLIMFKTAVRAVSITTLGEDKDGQSMPFMGDRAQRSAPPCTNHAASQVQTIVDLKPSEACAPPSNKIQIKDLLAEPIEEKIKVDELKPIVAPEVTVKVNELTAHYIRDTIADGSVMIPNQEFVQSWTLENPGPHAWPAGCSVRFVGGDNMLNIDNIHPSSTAHIASATESNVIDRSVKVGESITFRVPMKASKREGTAISYWRLKTADGFPFGHRLWCHIKVAAPPATFSGLNDAARDAPIAASGESFADMLRTMRTRALAANAGHEAAQAAVYEQKKAKEYAELPVERSAVELDRTVSEVADSVISEKAKQKIFSIPVTDGKTPKASTPSTAAIGLPASVEDDTQSAASSSTMIFPKLDKESPAASMHEELQQPAEVDAAPVVSAVTSPAPTHATLELFDDAESVVVDGLVSSDEDEPFLTDEEYDILDASDEEDF